MKTKTWQERLSEAMTEYNHFIKYDDEVNRGFKPLLEGVLFRGIKEYLMYTGNQGYGYECNGRIATIRGFIKGQPFIVDLTKEFTKPESRGKIKYSRVQTIDEFLDFYDSFK